MSEQVEELLPCEALVEHWKGQCNRYVNGQCTTSRCLYRGGYKIGEIVDYSLATCEEHETVLALSRTTNRGDVEAVAKREGEE